MILAVYKSCGTHQDIRNIADYAYGLPTVAFFLAVIVLLVLFAGLMSGLTLGLMSLSLVDLEVLAKSGTPKDRQYAGNSI